MTTLLFRRSDQQNSGRYVFGGQVEVLGTRLGWWERTIFPKSTSDVKVTIISKYRGRPDNLAYDLYGKANLQWFILQYNNIVDVTTEFVEGVELILPTKARLFGELLVRKNKK